MEGEISRNAPCPVGSLPTEAPRQYDMKGLGDFRLARGQRTRRKTHRFHPFPPPPENN